MTDNRPTDGVDISVAHRLLSSRVRRAVVCDLRERDSGLATVESVVSSVSDRVADSGRRSLRTQLHHTHLPKLDSAGVVDYHHDRCVVSYTGDPTVERLLELDRTV